MSPYVSERLSSREKLKSTNGMMNQKPGSQDSLKRTEKDKITAHLACNKLRMRIGHDKRMV